MNPQKEARTRPPAPQPLPPRSRRPTAPLDPTQPAEAQELHSLENELLFDHLELLNVWGRYKASPSESSDDKLERLSKLVGTLKSTLLGYPSQRPHRH